MGGWASSEETQRPASGRHGCLSCQTAYAGDMGTAPLDRQPMRRHRSWEYGEVFTQVDTSDKCGGPIAANVAKIAVPVDGDLAPMLPPASAAATCCQCQPAMLCHPRPTMEWGSEVKSEAEEPNELPTEGEEISERSTAEHVSRKRRISQSRFASNQSAVSNVSLTEVPQDCSPIVEDYHPIDSGLQRSPAEVRSRRPSYGDEAEEPMIVDVNVMEGGKLEVAEIEPTTPIEEDDEISMCGAEEEVELLENRPSRQTLVMNESRRMPSRRSHLVIENFRLLECVYDVEESVISGGDFGFVRRASRRATSAVRAIKSISKERQEERTCVLQTEIEIMKMVDHPNILGLHEIFEDDQYMHFVLEICTGGQLLNRVESAGFLSEKEAAIMMRQILRAVAYLHKNCICHRDIKPRNCLLVNAGPTENAGLRITDFGKACKFKPGEVLTGQVGTVEYMSPQVAAKKPRYDCVCDLWSCGVLMYNILCGKLPFTGKTNAAVRKKVCSGDLSFQPAARWCDISETAMGLIQKLLTLEPSDRPSAEQALRHAWVQKRAPKMKYVPLRPNIVYNLRLYRSQNKFLRAALQLIVTLLCEEDIHELRETFLSLDVNGDGLFSVGELRQRLRRARAHGKSEDLTESMFKNADSDDGEADFSYTEFLAATFDRERYCQEAVCRAAFNFFDADGNGTISKEELARGDVLGKLSDDEIKRLVHDLDVNGDGEIDFSEFMTMMKGRKKD
eukprot:gnl/TRDRNA2_/TRDRNA2_128598_c0_seq1.p1 gnl/TRDRNA2_/TRDRNA2_128598_c0~~gnl/TRDRNA2_/TRDRNA2_128598_c0_seq1.p1  ORF type:complete len:733 (-),score=130.00 gnl/TRDRNA2_/TRDRNA2_128598_c0_seq1:65-2263(-)